MRLTITFPIVALLVLILSAFYAESAIVITSADIEATDGNETQSGNGLLDYVLFLEASGGGVAENSAGGFDGDDANTDLPTGSKDTTANESFVTSIGELRAFYLLNFPGVDQDNFEMQIFVDMNQTGQNGLSLDALEIVLNYDSLGDIRDNPYANDVPPELQNLTNDGYSGGTLLAYLGSPVFLAHNQQGAGWADYTIFTGINPFDDSFNDSDRILFHWESSLHDDGGETVFLSGSFIDTPIPEPSLVVLSSLVLAAFLRKKRR